MTSSEFTHSTKEARVAALDDLVSRGIPVGILAYQGDTPVGWCAVAPRETFRALERSRALARIDDTAVWSVVCFLVDRRVRRHGLTVGLLRAAVRYARTRGATVIEGYPVAPKARLYTYMGTIATFERAGFREAHVSSDSRRIMRYTVNTATQRD